MCVAGGWLFVIANEEKWDTLDNTDMEDLVDDEVFYLSLGTIRKLFFLQLFAIFWALVDFCQTYPL